MQKVIDSFLAQLATLLGPLSPFAKAIVPSVLPLAYAIVRAVSEGKVDAVTITSTALAAVLSVVTYLVPNKPQA